ncbi:hypothetical protein FE257_007763 [Aspergillus nanangensis]|uniref:Endoplasmic reticulum lectin n=1 Tax=Aspergillus nanangensis TaxID=2582783 RepID=A0AAD4CXG6_ASPNN|nr:hypothetical protein FE257_007763 [Aspergillus nanangensis]
MGRRNRMIVPWLVLACAGSTAGASKKAFNINDDLLALPQFQVLFPDEYILDLHAKELLETRADSAAFDESPVRSEQTQVHLQDDTAENTLQQQQQQKGNADLTYEEMILDDRRYFCQIPLVASDDGNRTDEKEPTEADEKRELARATDRGIELLSEMEGKCLYFISGWWSYSFCYQKQVKQFHALPSGSGIPNYPPMEDPTTHSFVLGQFPDTDGYDGSDSESDRKKPTAEIAELQTKGGSRYLVHHLQGGTTCDLTGRDRNIEVQFHCHPQSSDRIGWIKELTTCSYLMVIYTPRLCNDVAFQPQQQEEVHSIECREILSHDDVPEWEAMREHQLSQQLVESAATSEFQIVGDVKVGAQKLVGSEGKRIEKGRVATAGEEKVDIVAKRENGEIKSLSRAEMEKFDLDPEKIDNLRKRLEELAEGRDWTLEVVTTNGERGLRGLVDADDDEEEEGDGQTGTAPETQAQQTTQQGGSDQAPQAQEEEEEVVGSEEKIFKDEL